MTQSNHLLSAEIIIRIRKTGKEETLTVSGIPCVWVWADGSRAAAEYWAVCDWISNTMGNNVDWFNIQYIVSTGDKGE